jgi:hypothetical protein
VRVNSQLAVERSWQATEAAPAWLADGSCMQLRPERANHALAYDFVEDRTCEGRSHRMLKILETVAKEASTQVLTRDRFDPGPSERHCPYVQYRTSQG